MPGPMLVIGPHGIMYRTYSPEVIPWSEVSEIKLQRSPRRRRQIEAEPPPVLTVPIKGHDPSRPRREENVKAMSILFNVRDPSQYRASDGFAHAMTRMGVGMLKGIPLQMAQASTSEILAAIKAYWPGDIPIVDPPDPFAMMGGRS